MKGPGLRTAGLMYETKKQNKTWSATVLVSDSWSSEENGCDSLKSDK